MSESRLSAGELDDLLMYLGRSKTVRKRALQNLSYKHFDLAVESPQALYWSALSHVAQEQDGVINYRTLRHEIERRLNDAPDTLTEDEVAWLLDEPTQDDDSAGLLYWIFKQVSKEDLEVKAGARLLQRFLYEREVVDGLRREFDKAAGGTPTNFAKLLANVQRRALIISSVHNDPVADLLTTAWQPVGVNKFPTGVTAFDALLDGGQAAGEIYGLLAPFSAGKTLLAVQLAVETAKFFRMQHEQTGAPLRHVFLFSYEADLDELRRRTMAYAAWIHKSTTEEVCGDFSKLSRLDSLKPYEGELARLRGGEIDGGEFERWMAAVELVGPVLHSCVMLGNDGSGTGFVDEIESVLHAKRDEKGWEPGAVIIDYVGKCVDRHIYANNLDPAKHTRHLIKRCVDQARNNIGKEFQVPVWALHQFNGEANGKKPGAKLHHSDAAECKSFGEAADFCLCLGMPNDKEHVAILNCSKGRRSADSNRTRLIKRLGDFGRYIDVDDQYTFDDVSGQVISKNLEARWQGDTAERKPAKNSVPWSTLGSLI